MKQDQLNQHIKHALESIEPEVPAHLWNNVKAGISTGAPASSGGEAAQSAASSAGSAGSAAALKIGAAAIAVIGGGLLVWHLATDSPKETSPITQKVEQSVDPSDERNDVNQPKSNAETTAPVISPEDQRQESNEEQMAHSSVDEPISDAVVKDSENHEQAVQEESAFNQEPNEADKVTAISEVETDQEMTGDDAQSASPAVVTEDRSIGHDEVGVVNEDEDQSETETMEMQVPLEAGILADKVSGEAPLTVNFANVADAHSFEWDFDNGRRSVEHKPVMTFTEPGDYMVRLVVRDEQGNRVNDQMEITVFEVSKIFVPDVITPNGDGVNDEFRVIGHNVTQVHFSIYRLDGTLVFESRSMNDAWDGIDAQTPQADKYIVEAVAVKTNGKPIQKRQMLHVLRE